MNELMPEQWGTEKQRIAHDIALDAVDALRRHNVEKYVDNLHLLDELRSYDLARHLRLVKDLYI